jgi:type IV fimbrial biogenesis protein FimT
MHGLRRSSNERGFTLVDMAMTILIIGILMASAAPKFAASVKRTQLDAAGKKLKADLTFARQRAINRSASQTVQFPTGTNSYTLLGLANPDRPSQTYAINLSQEPFRTTISSATVGGDQEIVFDRFGRPDSAGTITLSAGGNASTVSINAATGMASVP